MARHSTIAEVLGPSVYVCESHSPWKRGSDENMNGVLRQYSPNGIDVSILSPEHLLAVEQEINARPRFISRDRIPR